MYDKDFANIQLYSRQNLRYNSYYAFITTEPAIES